MLKWLRTGAWPKFTDILAAIRQELQSVQPIDTASIRWEKDAEGMRAYYTGRTGGGGGLTVDEGGESSEAEEYEGKFKVGTIADKLYIYDGSDDDGANAGYIIAGTVYVAFPKTELALADGDVYVILTYTPSIDDIPAFWTTSFHQGTLTTSPFLSNPRAAHFLIATRTGTTIIQQHTAGNIVVTGRWI